MTAAQFIRRAMNMAHRDQLHVIDDVLEQLQQEVHLAVAHRCLSNTEMKAWLRKERYAEFDAALAARHRAGLPY